MALPFPNFHGWLWRNPNPNPNPIPNTNPNFPVSSADSYAALDVDAYQFSRNPDFKKSGTAAESRKVYGGNGNGNRRRLQRGRRKIQSLDLDFDMVLVPSDYFSGSESEGSDWSVGWFEPHAPDFCSDGEPENSFAVLVPCYGSPSPDCFGGKGRFGQEENSSPHVNSNTKSQLWAAVLSNIAKDPHAETNHYLQQWLSSLQS